MVNGKVRGAYHENPLQRLRIKAGLSQEKRPRLLGVVLDPFKDMNQGDPIRLYIFCKE